LLEINERLENLETSSVVDVKISTLKKRKFTFTKQKILFDKKPCDLFVISEQTSFYLCEKAKKKNLGIKLANSVVYNQGQ
jgi:hypothetical protein